MKNKVKPTKLQLKTLEIKQNNPNMPLGKAMIQAGYSPTTAQAPSANYLEKRGTQTAFEKMKIKLTDLGLNEEFMANKYKEWSTAQKRFSSHTEPDRMVPDYDTQLKVKDDLNKILGTLPPTEQGNLKRKMTVEEFFES